MTLWVVKTAWRDKSGTEKYHTRAVRGKWMADAYNIVEETLKIGERIVLIAEGGYQ